MDRGFTVEINERDLGQARRKTGKDKDCSGI